MPRGPKLSHVAVYLLTVALLTAWAYVAFRWYRKGPFGDADRARACIEFAAEPNERERKVILMDRAHIPPDKIEFLYFMLKTDLLIVDRQEFQDRCIERLESSY